MKNSEEQSQNALQIMSQNDMLINIALTNTKKYC